jgi:hypothetical protein
MSAPDRIQIIIEMAAHAPDHAAVLEDIRTLTATPAPLIGQVERTLADGYACAMGLEAERLRLRLRLEERAAALGDNPGSERIGEIAGLGQRLARTESELVELRAALLELAAKARRLRAA